MCPVLPLSLSRSMLRERVGVRGSGRPSWRVAAPHPNPLPAEGRGEGLALPRHRALELAQHLVAAGDRVVERLLGRLLAGQRRLDLLGPTSRSCTMLPSRSPREFSVGSLLVSSSSGVSRYGNSL